MNTFEMLKKVCESYGPAGREAEIRKTIEKLVKPLGYKTTTDALGNLICHKAGKGAKLMFAAHMDSLGLIATYFEEGGQVRFGCIGGINPFRLLAASVRFANGVCGTVEKDGDVDFKDVTIEKLYIDLGVQTKEEAMKLVSVGDVAVYDSPIRLCEGGKFAMGAYLDDRAGCVAQLLAMEQIKETDNDLYFVFSTQEELGLRGAKVATFAIDPDYMIACDVTHSDDSPKAPHVGSCKAGCGAAIKVMDRSVICHPEVVDKLVSLAKEKNIRFAMDVIKAGGTDAGAAQLSLDGVPAGGVSMACRYTHSPNEMVSISDVEDCAKLMAAFAAAEF